MRLRPPWNPTIRPACLLASRTACSKKRTAAIAVGSAGTSATRRRRRRRSRSARPRGNLALHPSRQAEGGGQANVIRAPSFESPPRHTCIAGRPPGHPRAPSTSQQIHRQSQNVVGFHTTPPPGCACLITHSHNQHRCQEPEQLSPICCTQHKV